jgi:hypothetical protein
MLTRLLTITESWEEISFQLFWMVWIAGQKTGRNFLRKEIVSENHACEL